MKTVKTLLEKDRFHTEEHRENLSFTTLSAFLQSLKVIFNFTDRSFSFRVLFLCLF